MIIAATTEAVEVATRNVGGVGLEGYLTVAAILFVIGIFGIFVNRRNVIIILMSIELMLLAVNINLGRVLQFPRRPDRANLYSVCADCCCC